MAIGQTFNFDLKLPQSPPTENKELYEQLEYLYKAVRILAETFEKVTAETISEILVEGANVSIITDLIVPSITIAVPAEGIQDVVAALVQEDWGIAIDYDDTAGTLTFRLKLHQHTPATASSSGQKGMVTYDASYLYICVAHNTWRRIPHATW